MSGLLSPQLLKQLERFRLLAIRRSNSFGRGERRSRARGQSVEFVDHRTYAPGDDFRYLDWNLFGRLDRLFLKLYEEERELPVRIFLDSSQSMTFGEPPKFDFARKIAAAIGYVALSSFDRVSVLAFPDRLRDRASRLSDTGLVPSTAPPMSEAEVAARGALLAVRGERMVIPFFRNLSALTPGGCVNLNEVLRREALKDPRPGLAIVLSDFLDPLGFETGLSTLVGRGFQVSVVQILARDELDPVASGDLRLVDSETGEVQEVTFGQHRRKAYRQAVERFIQKLKEFCTAHRVSLFTVISDDDFESLLLKQFRAAGVWG